MNSTSADNKPLSSLSSRSRGSILVVDDQEQNRMLLRDPLEAHGYEVIEAQDGEQALQRVAERHPDVILLDVMMPKMDGFEVCRRLKANSSTSSIPVLIVTALSERKERMMGIAAGANDFLNKPVDLPDLTLRVRNATYLRQLFGQLRTEQQNSERLLLNILPKGIAERMKKGEVNIAEQYSDVTVLVADLVGFTVLSAHIGPEQIVSLLNEIFSAFDVLVGKRGLEKIKTIGDAYMVAGGLTSHQADHAINMTELALDLRKEIERLNNNYSTSLRIRVGISTGPVVAGVIGRTKFSYDLWGDTVNLACRLENICEIGSITVAEATYQRVKQVYRFPRKRTLNLRGKGETSAYELEERI